MDLKEFLDRLNNGETVEGGSPTHLFMHKVSQEALRITAELNGAYHSPEEVRRLFSELTGKTVDESFGLFPPFYSDCGKNITVGKNVFINSGCRFQDQGGITIGDGTLIGHNVVLATLNHDFSPKKRSTMHPAPIVIGKKEGAYAATGESTAFPNLGYETTYFLGPGEIVRLRADGMEQLRKPNKRMQIQDSSRQ